VVVLVQVIKTQGCRTCWARGFYDAHSERLLLRRTSIATTCVRIAARIAWETQAASRWGAQRADGSRGLRLTTPRAMAVVERLTYCCTASSRRRGLWTNSATAAGRHDVAALMEGAQVLGVPGPRVFALYHRVAELKGNLFDYNSDWNTCYAAGRATVPRQPAVWGATDLRGLVKLPPAPTRRQVHPSSRARRIPLERVANTA